MKAQDIMICNNCGLPFDMADLHQVTNHEHRNIKMELNKIDSKKVISDVRDIYPKASPKFLAGARSYYQDDFEIAYFHLESEEFKQGYFQAHHDGIRDSYVVSLNTQSHGK